MLTATELRRLKKITLHAINQTFVKAGRRELTDQGHRATGTLIDTMQAVMVNETPASWRAGIEIEAYGLDVDTGTKPQDVPSPFKDPAEFKKHIEQISDWSKKVRPGLDDLERSNFILATNRRHRIEGIPTTASLRFSKVGRRTGWIKNSFEQEQTQEDALKKLRPALFGFYTAFFDRAIEQAQTTN